MAATNARPGVKVERILLWGDLATAKPMLAAWESKFEIPVEAVDPLSLVDLKRSAESHSNTGRFAPLLGMLLQRRLSPQATTPANTFIDFLHPRQRPEKKKPLRTYALAAVAAALILGSVSIGIDRRTRRWIGRLPS